MSRSRPRQDTFRFLRAPETLKTTIKGTVKFAPSVPRRYEALGPDQPGTGRARLSAPGSLR
jgi:hypothetical protein